MMRLDHIGIATPDLDAGSVPYLALGLKPEQPDIVVEAQDVLVRIFVAGDTKVELLAPRSLASPIAKYLSSNRAGLHHIAYRVDDIESEIARLSLEGADFISTKPTLGIHGSKVVFLHPKWGAGTLIELCQPSEEDHS